MTIIDGEREARLSWRAVQDSFPSLAGPRTVLDIGGGSTELLVGEADVEGVRSLAIGSVRLTERLIHHDPPTVQEREQLVADHRRRVTDCAGAARNVDRHRGHGDDAGGDGAVAPRL